MLSISATIMSLTEKRWRSRTYSEHAWELFSIVNEEGQPLGYQEATRPPQVGQPTAKCLRASRHHISLQTPTHNISSQPVAQQPLGRLFAALACIVASTPPRVLVYAGTLAIELHWGRSPGNAPTLCSRRCTCIRDGLCAGSSRSMFARHPTVPVAGEAGVRFRL
jgi:hypothetical protein